jgi:hypothetical protein
MPPDMVVKTSHLAIFAENYSQMLVSGKVY